MSITASRGIQVVCMVGIPQIQTGVGQLKTQGRLFRF